MSEPDANTQAAMYLKLREDVREFIREEIKSAFKDQNFWIEFYGEDNSFYFPNELAKELKFTLAFEDAVSNALCNKLSRS